MTKRYLVCLLVLPLALMASCSDGGGGGAISIVGDVTYQEGAEPQDVSGTFSIKFEYTSNTCQGGSFDEDSTWTIAQDGTKVSIVDERGYSQGEGDVSGNSFRIVENEAVDHDGCKAALAGELIAQVAGDSLVGAATVSIDTEGNCQNLSDCQASVTVSGKRVAAAASGGSTPTTEPTVSGGSTTTTGQDKSIEDNPQADGTFMFFNLK